MPNIYVSQLITTPISPTPILVLRKHVRIRTILFFNFWARFVICVGSHNICGSIDT